MRHFKVEHNLIYPMHQGVREFYLKYHLRYDEALPTLIYDITTAEKAAHEIAQDIEMWVSATLK